MSFHDNDVPPTDSQLFNFLTVGSFISMVMFSECLIPNEKLGPVFLLIQTYDKLKKRYQFVFEASVIENLVAINF